MTTSPSDQLIEQYLTRLAAAAAPLQQAQRDDLVSEIREHIDVALHEEEPSDESGVRKVLERLGPPEEIAAAAHHERPAGTPSTTTHRRGGPLEWVAIAVLFFSGYLVPPFGWLGASVLVTFSRCWSRREKLVGIIMTSAALPAWVFTAAGPITAMPLTSLLIGPLAAAYLVWRLKRRTQPAAATMTAQTPNAI